MKHLYFVRHGLSQANADRVFGGLMDTPLTEEGREQARLAAAGAKALNIDHIISSPLSRAYETAKIIAEQIGYPVDAIELNNLLVERDYGALQGQLWGPDDDVIDSTPGVESMVQVLERAKLACEYIAAVKAETILVVSHGTFALALRHAIHPEIPFTRVAELPNAQIVQFI